jgi:hypothetical protein
LFLRYKVQTEREYRRALEDFERLKALRHELPNEPISGAEPEPIETTCDSLPTDPIPPQKPGPHAAASAAPSARAWDRPLHSQPQRGNAAHGAIHWGGSSSNCSATPLPLRSVPEIKTALDLPDKRAPVAPEWVQKGMESPPRS